MFDKMLLNIVRVQRPVDSGGSEHTRSASNTC